MWAASQPVNFFFHRRIDPMNKRGTDKTRSAIANPYTVARFDFASTVTVEDKSGSLNRAKIQNDKCSREAIPFTNEINFKQTSVNL